MSKVPPLFRGGISVLTWLLAILLIAQVIFRYLLNSSLVWGEELTRYTMVLIVCLGAIPLVFAQRLSAFSSAETTVSRGFAALGALVRLAFYLAFGISTLLLMQKSGAQKSIALGWPMVVVYAPMLIFSIAATLISLRQIFRPVATGERSE